MDTILEGTGVSFPKRMDVTKLVIIVELTIQISAQQIVESLHKPGKNGHIIITPHWLLKSHGTASYHCTGTMYHVRG